MITVLVSSAGRRGGLINCLRDSARRIGTSIRIVAADVRPDLSAACHLADEAVSVPRCTSAGFVDAIVEQCRRTGATLVIPTIDSELLAYAGHLREFSAAGVTVNISSESFVITARDKAKTAAALSLAGVATPRTLSGAEFAATPSTLRWPVIVKPAAGSSSVGIVRPQSVGDAVAACRSDPSAIAQELWVGREYTVNLYFDLNGVLRCAIPHLRIETRGGEVSKGRTEDIPQLRSAAQQIARSIPGARGALCFQAIVTDSGEYAVFEINARFGGGYPLAHQAGGTFTQWLLEEALGLPCSAHDNWRAGITMLRYDDAVFLNA